MPPLRTALRTQAALFFLILAYALWMFEPGGRVYWPFLIGSYLIAYLVFHDRQKGLKESSRDFFSPKIWRHETSLNESLVVIFCFFFSYYVLDKIDLLSSRNFNNFFENSYTSFGHWLGFTAMNSEPTLTATIIYIVASFLAFDFGYFLAHYLMHKFRFLWEFHKVHHSAQVMTPITSLRQHPIEVLFNRCIRLLFLGIVNGVFFYAYPFYPTLTVIASTNAILFLFLFFGSALGHSHIWVSFGKFEKILISPSMHQVHHSIKPKHFNKNFGLALSIWDRMFGTSYPTPAYEEITFGLDHENMKFLSMKDLMISPFSRSARHLAKPFRRKKQSKL